MSLSNAEFAALLNDDAKEIVGDITAGPEAALAVWTQFCREAKITHTGQMQPLPPTELDLLP